MLVRKHTGMTEEVQQKKKTFECHWPTPHDVSPLRPPPSKYGLFLRSRDTNHCYEPRHPLSFSLVDAVFSTASAVAMCISGRWNILVQVVVVLAVGLDIKCDGFVPSARLPVSSNTRLAHSAPASARATRRPRSQRQELRCLTPIPRCAADSVLFLISDLRVCGVMFRGSIGNMSACFLRYHPPPPPPAARPSVRQR